MKKLITIILAAAAAFLVSCEKSEMDNLEIQDLTCMGPRHLSLTKSQTEMTYGINRFTYDMFREAYEDKDVFISPFSISLALAMLTTGSDGNTEKQLLSALGFEGKTTEELDLYYSTVVKNMVTSDPSTTLNIANAIWSDKNIVIKSQFTDDCRRYFESVAESVDFSDPSTLKKLNDWTSEHTNGKIDKMFDRLPGGVAAVLANALYYKASWPFEFTRSGDRMLAKVKTTYFEGEHFSGVQIPYGNGTFAMRIILPSKNTDLGAFVNKLDDYLNDDYLKYTISESAIVSLTIPAFSFSYENHLNDALKKLGVIDAYSPSVANFSKMSDYDLVVDDVLHKTFVDVNEHGTEAAAITAVTMKVSSAGDSTRSIPREVVFKVDRDFIFQIIDCSSGLTLFIGQHKM